MRRRELPNRRPRAGSAAALVTVVLIFAIAGCSAPGGGVAATQPPPSTTTAPTVPMATPAAAQSQGPAPTDAGATPTPVGVVLTEAWATADLTDVRNGEQFRIADLVADGRVVFIQTMAIWCSNCRAQQRDVVTALTRLDPARVTWISVDVELSESPSDLAEYSRTLGFDWPFVVASADLSRALADDFGTQVLSPPSTPIIVVGVDGKVTLTEFGHKSVDRIVELAVAHGA